MQHLPAETQHPSKIGKTINSPHPRVAPYLHHPKINQIIWQPSHSKKGKLDHPKQASVRKIYIKENYKKKDRYP